MRLMAGLLILCFILVAGACTSIEKTVQHIDKRYDSVKGRLSELNSDTSMVYDLATEGSEIVRFHQGDETVFIKAAHFYESGHSFEEYLLSDGEMILMRGERHDYNAPYYVNEDLAEEIGLEAFDSA